MVNSCVLCRKAMHTIIKENHHHALTTPENLNTLIPPNCFGFGEAATKTRTKEGYMKGSIKEKLHDLDNVDSHNRQ